MKVRRARPHAPPSQTWDKYIKPIPMVQWLIVIILCTHVLISEENALTRQGNVLFVLVLLASNLALLYVLPRLMPLKAITSVLVIIDTVLVPVTLFATGTTGTDLFVIYFGIIMIAAASGNLKRALVLAGLTWVAYIGFTLISQQEYVPPEVILLRLPMLLAVTLFYGSIGEFVQHDRADREKIEQQSKQIRAMFSNYVSPRIVEELIKDPTKARLGGQRKELSMLFCDLVGFTTFSESHSAEEVVAQLNEYLAAMTEVVFYWNGTLDKFVGDAVVAFWGAPLDQPDHAELALKCALHMRKRLGELRAQWKVQGKPLLDNGIGLNTGEVLVGNIGAEGKKMDYTVIGDHMNLAARIESLSRKFSPIMISEFTAERVKALIAAQDTDSNRGHLGHVALRKLGSVRVKGRDRAVVVYSLESLPRHMPSCVEEEAPSDILEMREK